METLQEYGPLLGGILFFAVLIAYALFVIDGLFEQWREEVKQDRRAWLEEKKRKERICTDAGAE